jgi:pilus assembly protein CpaE
VNSDSSLYLDDPNADSFSVDILSIALIGPDDDSRQAAASVIAGCQCGEIREFSSYPASLDDLPRLLEQRYDVIIIDLDSRPEYALELVESICTRGTATVMVYSAKADSELLVRCMRAGAREFLTLPFVESTVAEALVRASARRPATPRPAKKAGGRLLAFLGAKGGDGVTTLACNFAVSLAQDSGQSTLLIDLDLPLGDAALNLGVVAEYSTINALQNASRLDSSFLSKLLVKHSSGVSVLAAPGKFPQFDAPIDAIDKLLTVARQDFENVVIDMGSRLDLMGTGLFKDGATVYLVIQSHIAGLRNSNRLISQYFSSDVPKLEIVLNRFQPRSLGVAEDQITKALTRPAQWKIPNDYAAVRRMQHTAIPLALEDSPISRLIHQMARCACGLPPAPEKGSGFSLRKISRSISAKISTPEETSAFTQLELSSGRDNARATSAVSQPEAPANIPEKAVYTPPAETVPAAETRALLTAGDTASLDDTSETKEEASQTAATPSQQKAPDTRIYQGATYVRGEDGRWHLQKTKASESNEEAQSAKKETPAIEWSTPDPIVYRTALSANQLNAVAPVPGTFAYAPAADEVLAAGTHTLSANFTPEDTATYAPAESTVSLTVTQAKPSIAWSTPAQIAYGTALSSIQLNAMASAPGTFAYKPDVGEVLTPGVQTLAVEFTPEDAANYTPAQASVSLTVTLTTPAISWPTPAPVAYGTALSAAQLNATAPVQGTFVYTPSMGEVLQAGEHTLSVTFTPKDTTAYRTAGAAVSLAVTKATPIVTWPAPAAIPYGAALSAAQLNATALVPGTLIYTPAADQVLPTGTHTLLATFMPTDTLDYTAVQATVPLTVTRATPAVLWPASDPITFGSAPSAAEFNVEPQPVPAKAAPVPATKPARPAKSAPIKVVTQAPVKAQVEVAAKPVVKARAKEPVKVAAKPPAKAPVAAPVKVAAKPPAKAPAKAHVKVVEEPVVKAAARPHVKLAARHWPKAPAEPSAEAPTNALVKVGARKAPIDVGPGLDLMGSAVLEDGTTIYLVMQPGSAGMLNSSRLVSQLFSAKGPKPGFVINRFEPHSPEGAEESPSAAGARTAASSTSGLRGHMARSADEAPEKPEKKTGFSLKGFGRSIWSRLATPERVPSMTRLGLAADPDDTGTPLGAAQPDTTARTKERPVYTSPEATLFTPAERTPFAPPETAHRAHVASAHHPAMHAAGASSHHEEPKTRTYRGATYVKGEDGQWHLQESGAKVVHHAAPPIPLPSSTPIASATQRNAKSRPALAGAAPARAKRPARKAKPAAKKLQAKASAKNRKKPAKPAAKPAAKAPAKRQVKAAQKPAAKAPAKRLAKPAAKPLAKPPAKRLVKAAAKPSAKIPAKSAGKAKSPAKASARRIVKAAAKPPVEAPARKPAPKGRKRPVFLSPKPAKRDKAPKPPVDLPAPEPEIKELPREPLVLEPVPELVKESQGTSQ